MKYTKNPMFEHCMITAGLTILAMALPILKFYVIAPQYFFQVFRPLV